MKKIILYFTITGILSCLFSAYSQTFAKKGSFINDIGGLMTGNAEGLLIKSDNSGSIYVVGRYKMVESSGDFEFDGDLFPIAPGEQDLCILKLNPAGTVIWGKVIDGNFAENLLYPGGLAIDNNGNVFLSGLFSKTVDFNPDPVLVNSLTASGTTLNNVFLLKLRNDGSFEWVDHFRSIGNTSSAGFTPMVSINPDQTIILTGTFNGSIDLDPSLFGLNIKNEQAGNAVFIVKLNQLGSHVWSRSIGGTSTTNATECYESVVDSNGGIYLFGEFYGQVDFNPNAGTNSLVNSGVTHANYLLKLDANSNYLLVKRFNNLSNPYGLDVDQNLNIYITGSYSGGATDFDPSPGVSQLPGPGFSKSGFVVSLTSIGTFRWVRGFLTQNGGQCQPDSIAVNGAGIYVTGGFSGNIDFDSSQLVNVLNGIGGGDIFLVKLSTVQGAGGAVHWAKRIGGDAFDQGYSIDLDPSGNLVTTGSFAGLVDFNPNAGAFFLDSSLPAPHRQLYVLKLNSNGSF